ncbi:MAG TPA: hypothetical protein PLM20_04660 [Syntrophomonadaceae bacterium]|nr:hypothetical protein [Syntrophomonadaceae bacterium]HQA06932.1 hypothetical protein [Syntrophomonadaceae bacterium]HQE23175.1 hypothetical protein [Syntrophomonadaceae bacterium]
MSSQGSPKNLVGFEVRIIFRDTQAIDLTKMAEATKKSMFDMMRIHVDKIKLKKYGLKLLGKGPIQEILRIGENFYQLTTDGGLEIIVNIGSTECFYMKEGCIHDLRDGSAPDIAVPTFDDDAEPDEEEYARIGL